MKKSAQTKIHISVSKQRLTLKSGRKKLGDYPVSTSRFGLGTEEGSMKTPTGRFLIAEKIGRAMPLGTVFKSRRPVKVTKKLMREADLVMTRILWLEGLDPGNANTRQRFIYIHGTNHEETIGAPASHGCIRMRNADVVELFARVRVDTPVVIKE
jgi:L,D-transpeptidase YbiS